MGLAIDCVCSRTLTVSASRGLRRAGVSASVANWGGRERAGARRPMAAAEAHAASAACRPPGPQRALVGGTHQRGAPPWSPQCRLQLGCKETEQGCTVSAWVCPPTFRRRRVRPAPGAAPVRPASTAASRPAPARTNGARERVLCKLDEARGRCRHRRHRRRWHVRDRRHPHFFHPSALLLPVAVESRGARKRGRPRRRSW